MLPATLQFVIAMIACAINEKMQRKLDYLEEERRVLHEQLDALTGGKKISFNAAQRRRLATAGKLLSPDERRKCCVLVKPATILAWFRQLAARKYDSTGECLGNVRTSRRRKVVHSLPSRCSKWGQAR
jgi:hypothetical protein